MATAITVSRLAFEGLRALSYQGALPRLARRPLVVMSGRVLFSAEEVYPGGIGDTIKVRVPSSLSGPR